MEKHGIVTIDFKVFNGPRYDLKVPFHITVRQLIEELAEIYGYSEIIKKGQQQSLKAELTNQFIPGNLTLLEVNVKEGEILYIFQ